MSNAKFSDRVAPADVPKMPEEYRDLLVRLLTIQADCEIGGPHVYGPRWFLGAPTVDDMFRVTHILAEEIDHFRAFNRLLRELDADRTSLLHSRPEDRFLEAFRETDLPTWSEVATFCCLIDRVGKFQLEEVMGCSYLPFDHLLPRVMLEEVGHIGYGTARLTELAANPATHQEAQAAVDKWYPRALDMFGRSGSRRAERFVYWGLKHRLNEEARREYIEEVTPLLLMMGLEVPNETTQRHYL